MSQYAEVILPLALGDGLTYGVPPALQPQLRVGCRVLVPLGRSKVYAGIVSRLHDDAPPSGVALKEILEIVDTTPLIFPEGLRFWEWLANYYMCTRGEVMKAALPAGLKLEDDERGYRPKLVTHVRLAEKYHSQEAINAVLDSLHRAAKQEACLLAYLDISGTAAALSLDNMSLVREITKNELLQVEGVSDAAFQALRQRGILETYNVEVGRLRSVSVLPDSLRKQLSEEQSRALGEIHTQFQQHDCCLLHGVTSSGKTEVYIRLIEETLARGEQVLYLLPEIAITTQIMQRLGRIFGDKLGVYHSKFPDAERVELWQKQVSDTPYSIVLGARSAIFLPFRRLGLIIVDEEHETSYKQQNPAPRYNARDAALVLARQSVAKVLLGTATPSIETYHNVETGRYGIVRMLRRYGNIEMPEVCVEDVRELRRKRLMPTPFSPHLKEAIREALRNKEQIILFQNRRGYSPVLQCRTCGWNPRCTRCDVPLTFHQREGKLVCHYCGASYDVPKQCPQCEDTELRDMGYGTEKIEAAVHAVFPEARTARMDLDTTRTRSGHEDILNAFAKGETDILIGTQMVTKGLDFERVRLVGIMNADQLLNKPDFRAHERAYQMMSQVAGRAGRRSGRGLVILQTQNADLNVVQQVVDSDYTALYRDEILEREAFGYPPFSRLIHITLRHADEHLCHEAARYFSSLIAPHFSPEDLLGPDRPAVSRIQSLHIRHLLLKVPLAMPPSGVRRTLLAARSATLAQLSFRRVLIHFDVDPL